MYRILEGMRIVEVASFIAAPSGALYLRELGADDLEREQSRLDALYGRR